MTEKSVQFNCPMPIQRYSKILMAHGGGGKLTHQLIEELFLPQFKNPHLSPLEDGAHLSFTAPVDKLAFTTDSYVVRPIFFPGGDIGRLAVFGTSNDLAMCGARPLYLSLGLILEEGLPIEELCKIVESIKEAASQLNVQIVTGDTKVIENSKESGPPGLLINTTGIGLFRLDPPPTASAIQPGDKIVLSGDIGRHGIAVMSVREGLTFEGPVESDLAPLWPKVKALIDGGISPKTMRDLTRGGLATALLELAKSSQKGLSIWKEKIPITPTVEAACEILGLDPLYIANEGRFIAIVSEKYSEETVKILKEFSDSKEAAIIGEITDTGGGSVTLINEFGARRALTMFSGEQLPRIC